MPGTVSIGQQDFATIITNGYFYVDKTAFIKEWWENGHGASTDRGETVRRSTGYKREHAGANQKIWIRI